MAASFSFYLVVVEQSSCVATGECTFDFHSKLNLCMATFYESGESSVKVKAAFDSRLYTCQHLAFRLRYFSYLF